MASNVGFDKGERGTYRPLKPSCMLTQLPAIFEVYHDPIVSLVLISWCTEDCLTLCLPVFTTPVQICSRMRNSYLHGSAYKCGTQSNRDHGTTLNTSWIIMTEPFGVSTPLLPSCSHSRFRSRLPSLLTISQLCKAHTGQTVCTYRGTSPETCRVTVSPETEREHLQSCKRLCWLPYILKFIKVLFL